MKSYLNHIAALLLAMMLLAASPARAADRPNILFVVFEDMSARVGAYGDMVANTPVLDAFAQESLLYTNAFTTSGVCAPSRAALITGRHQQTIGAQHMRTNDGVQLPNGERVAYEAVPPAEVKAFPELLRAAGYYTTNNGKTDYQMGGPMAGPFTIWDEQAAEHPWRGRAAGQPFFAMVNVMGTHESQLFDPERINENSPFARIAAGMRGVLAKRPPLTDPALVRVPPYLPDTPDVRRDIARHYDNIHYSEQELAQLLQQLEEDGLAENTIVIVTSDHGDGLPRAKRSAYDSGLHVPLMIRRPSGEGAGERNLELVSFIDLAPTILSFAGVEVPGWMDGRVFTGDVGTPERGYIYAAVDRHDELPDYSRAVRDARWKYIRNMEQDLAFFRPLAFRDTLVSMRDMWRLYQEGGLTPLQQSYFESPRAAEELYDTWGDPDEVRNLATDPEYAEELERMRAAWVRFQSRVPDLSSLGEQAMVEQMWPGLEQPVTAAPTVTRKAGRVVLSSPTEGASVGYRIDGGPWKLYTAPVQVPAGSTLEAKAVRYGYAESEIVTAAR